jgi:peptidyl-prolyl cis-trans isomerase C
MHFIGAMFGQPVLGGIVKRMIVMALLAAFPAAAQQSAPLPDAEKPVAVLNGETITVRTLDQLYDRLGAQMRQQYEKSGGKTAFLENYLRKRLIIQEALKAGLDKRADVQADMQAAKDATLFDRYVRDVVSASIVTDAAVRDYYDQHRDEFATAEKIHVRHIVVTASNAGRNPRSKEQALEIIKKVSNDRHKASAAIRAMTPAAGLQMRLIQFSQLARQYSEDASAEKGGDLGWVTSGMLDPTFEAAAFALPPGVPSGIVETKFGYHIILVEEKKPGGTESFEVAKPQIREFLMTQKAADVMQALTKLTNELRARSKTAIYPENIK